MLNTVLGGCVVVFCCFSLVLIGHYSTLTKSDLAWDLLAVPAAF